MGSRLLQHARLIALMTALLGSSVAIAASSFEQVFDSQGEPEWLHYAADYRDHQGWHRLQVWRDRDARIVRRTDARIDVQASRRGDDIRFLVGDRLRRIVTTVDRATLMRMGSFVDWFAQAHAIKRPTGAYAITALHQTEQIAGRVCETWRLAADVTTDICWDNGLKIPLLMRDQNGEISWRVTAFDLAPIADQQLAINSDGLAQIDMNAEFDAEAD